MTDDAAAIRMEIDAALTALATAIHALDVASVLARRSGDPVACHRHMMAIHDLRIVVDRIKGELER